MNKFILNSFLLLILFCSCNLFCQSINNSIYKSEKNKFSLNAGNGIDTVTESSFLSVGGGVHYNSYAKGYTNFLFSFKFTPHLYKILYLSCGLDAYGLMDYNITAVTISVSPLIKFYLFKNKFCPSLGIGGAFYILGDRGVDASLMPSVQFAYNLNKFFELGIEARKPIFLYEDSGHDQILFNINLNFKLYPLFRR
jgi:hypothetical protein